jgi:hypothetical protein
MGVSRLSSGLVAAAVAALAGACGKSDDEPTNNGVADVHKACEIRASWKRTKEEKCVFCLSAAPLQRCDCEALQPFSGSCQKQGENYRAACSQQVIDCASHCAETDCACIDRCYAAADECTVRAAQRDGCVAEQCAPYCQ